MEHQPLQPSSQMHSQELSSQEQHQAPKFSVGIDLGTTLRFVLHRHKQ